MKSAPHLPSPEMESIINAFLRGADANDLPADIFLSESLWTEAAFHGLSPILAELALQHGNNSEIIEYARRILRSAATQKILREQTLKEIGNAFAHANINAIATKGTGTTVNFYQKSELRPASDIDLIIHPKQFDRAIEIAMQSGFTPLRDPPDGIMQRDPITLDLAPDAFSQIKITSLPSEKLTFPKLDSIVFDNAIQSHVTGISHMNIETEFLIATLHYAYKHRFERHIWAIDLLLMMQEIENLNRWEKTIILFTESHSIEILFHTFCHLKKIAHFIIPQKNQSILPIGGSTWTRRKLFKKCSNQKTGMETGYLLALACSRNWNFRTSLLKRMLLPQKKRRGGIISHLISLPIRLWRGL